MKNLNIQKFKKILIGLILVILVYIAYRISISTQQGEIITRFTITEQERRLLENKIFVVETFPQNNSQSYANSLNVLFSEPIIGTNIQVETEPKIEVETTVFEDDPNRFFITPIGSWEKINYKITLKSNILPGGYTFNVTFIEEPIPDYFIDERNLY